MKRAVVNLTGDKQVLQSLPPYSTISQAHDKLQDLKLLWYYITVLCPADTRDPVVREIRQTDVVEEALRHDFLLEGILSMAAIHLVYSGDEPARWVEVAKAKRQAAISIYIRVLNDINQDNSKAVFMFSTILTVLSIASPVPACTGIHVAPIHKVLALFALVRGVAAVLQRCHGLLVSTRIGQMSTRASKLPLNALPTDTAVAFASLRSRLNGMTLSDPDERTAYEVAITDLERIFGTLSGTDVDVDCELVFQWAITCGQPYTQLLQLHRIPALAILSFYGLLLHRLEAIWFMRGWGVQLVDVIWEQLDEDWRRSLDWARLQTRADVNASK